MPKKYFNTRKEAETVKAQRDPDGFKGLKVYKMRRGTNKGKFAVCDWMQYLNTY